MKLRRPASAVSGLLVGLLVVGGAPTIATGADGVGQQEAMVAAAATDPDTAFVQAAYFDFLGREATAAEVQNAVNRLKAGTSASQFLQDLARSPEWTTHVIQQMYRDTLGREPDAGGLEHWRNQLISKRMTVAQVAGNFYSSAEYYTRLGGGTERSWVTDLYRKLLKREPDAGGLEYWVARTKAIGRGPVAYSYYQGLETRRTRVNTLYQSLLGRSADPGGLVTWSQKILNGDDLALAVSLAASPEYRQRAIAREAAGFGSFSYLAAGQGGALSADGRWLLASQSGALALFDLNTGARTEVVSGDVKEYDVSNDGRFVAYSSAGGTFVWKRATGQRMQIGAAGTNVRVSGDGTSVVLTRGDAVRLLTSTGADLELGKGSQPDISADGRLVAFAAADGRLNLWSATDGSTQIVPSPEAGFVVRQPSVSADGTRIAYQVQNAPTDPSRSDVWMFRRDGNTNTRITSTEHYSGSPSISGNGSRIAFLSQAPDLAGSDSNAGLDAFIAEPSTPGGAVRISRLTGHATTTLSGVATDPTGNRVVVAASGALPGGTEAGIYVWRRG